MGYFVEVVAQPGDVDDYQGMRCCGQNVWVHGAILTDNIDDCLGYTPSLNTGKSAHHQGMGTTSTYQCNENDIVVRTTSCPLHIPSKEPQRNEEDLHHRQRYTDSNQGRAAIRRVTTHIELGGQVFIG